jgi:type I restriction enzyme S subunit
VPPVLLEIFEDHVASALQRVLKSVEQSLTLAALRDALLPKLISGELRVTDAEKFIARAV